MEVGTTSRWGALALIAGLLCAAFAIDRFQTREENALAYSLAAPPSQPTQGQPPIVLTRAGPALSGWNRPLE